MSFEVGDAIVYGGSGVCEIDGIESISFYHERPQKYYVLKPMFVKQSSVVYVPMNNEEQVSKIKPVISKQEAIKLIKQIPLKGGRWIEDRNERRDTFNDIVNTGSRKEIVKLISLIESHKDALAEEGKRLNTQDERVLSEAMRRISAEFAVALDMEPEEINEIIRNEELKAKLA